MEDHFEPPERLPVAPPPPRGFPLDLRELPFWAAISLISLITITANLALTDVTPAASLHELPEQIVKTFVRDIDPFTPFDEDPAEIAAIFGESSGTVLEGAIPAPPIPSQPPREKPARARLEHYIVEQGDTISAIAARFGLRQSTLAEANNLPSIHRLKPGQKLTIPAADGIIHTVSKGESISEIVKRYSGDLEKTLAVNGLRERPIQIGERIVVVSGKRPTPPPRLAVSSRNVLIRGGRDEGADATGPLRRPTSGLAISQGFHHRHRGIDLPARQNGWDVFAAGSGRVLEVGRDGGYGLRVIIQHTGGLQTLYAHLSRVHVSEGKEVSGGDRIGTMGTSGFATGPHLHFEVRRGGVSQNPLNYLR